MRKLFLLTFLISCFGFAASSLHATATLTKQGCFLEANTVQGYMGNCPNKPQYPAYNPYRFSLQKKMGNSFVEVDNSGWIGFRYFDFPLHGLGTFRVVAEVWQADVIFQTYFSNDCNSLQKRTFTSSSIEVTSTKEWVSYPLVGGDNADEFMALRHFSSENSYYHVSSNRLWENRWTGSSWARSQVAPLPPNSIPASDDVHGPVACVPGNSALGATNIYYVTNGSRIGRFTRNSSGTYVASFVVGRYPLAHRYGQIAAGSEGPIYANGIGKVWLLSQITNNEVEVSSVAPFGSDALPYLVRTTNGTVVYLREGGDLVAANLSTAGGVHSYTLNGTSGTTNASESELATDGTNVFYRANDGSVWIWPRNSNGSFGTPARLPGIANCDGYLAASPERPMEVFYKGNFDRMWTFKFESSTGWRQMPMADRYNVKGPIIAKTKVAYRNSSNTIWHQYEVNCPGKKDVDFDLAGPEKLAVTAFPNPATDRLTVRIDAPEAVNGDLSLYDMTGKVVRQLTQNHAFGAGAHEVELSVSDLPAGTYLLRWSGGGTVSTSKVSVQ